MTAFTLRPMLESERAFVAKSWVESHATSALSRVLSLDGTLGDPGRAWQTSREYWTTWHGLVDALLDRSCTRVLEDDHGLIAGFICWQPWESAVAVHYVYVRLMYRKQGLARVLVDALPSSDVYYTHRSRGITRVPDGWTYSIRPIFDLLMGKEAA